jgi:hypothetical protein
MRFCRLPAWYGDKQASKSSAGRAIPADPTSALHLQPGRF